jgi:hypothetical protein
VREDVRHPLGIRLADVEVRHRAHAVRTPGRHLHARMTAAVGEAPVLHRHDARIAAHRRVGLPLRCERRPADDVLPTSIIDRSDAAGE